MLSTCDYKDQTWSRLCHIFFPPCATRGPSQVQGSHCGGSPGAGSGPTDGQPAPPRCRTPASSWTARATTHQSNPHAAEHASRLLWPQSFWAETNRGHLGRLPTPGKRQTGFRDKVGSFESQNLLLNNFLIENLWGYIPVLSQFSESI